MNGVGRVQAGTRDHGFAHFGNSGKRRVFCLPVPILSDKPVEVGQFFPSDVTRADHHGQVAVDIARDNHILMARDCDAVVFRCRAMVVRLN